jgi:hypothetical protein
MAKRKTREKFTVRFTVKSRSMDSLTGMIQTEDQDEQEKRLLLDDSGVAEVDLPAGQYTFVWAVKMTPIKSHHYSIVAERIPDAGAPVELRLRKDERTTTKGEDVGFDEFTL